jgi:hypothetical protein
VATHRATKAEMTERRESLASVVTRGAPMSVRHAFYQAVGMGIVPKTRNGYQKVQREILRLRREGLIGYDDIVDGTRYVRRSQSHDSLGDALYETSRTYRRNLWSESPYQLEVWAESDSIAGTAWPAVDVWGLPLFVTRGYASETFLWNSAQQWYGDVVVLYIGDYDPHGVLIEDVARSRMQDFAGLSVEWHRIAVTPEQVDEYDLPSSYGGHGVEAEALDADTLRTLLEAAILEYVDEAQVETIRVAERSEREVLREIVATKSGAA